MPKATMPFGEWRPDIAALDNQFAGDVENVFSSLNSYQPIPSLLPFSNVMVPDPPIIGLASARLADGTWTIYAGTAAKLYNWSSTGWTDVSKAGGYHAPAGERWSFAQFGENLIACQVGDPIQTINVDGALPFADLAGSPPISRTCRVIGDFLVLAGIEGTGSSRRSITWSGINDTTQWTPGLELSDIQEFADGGLVMGVAGNESVGYVVQDRSIRAMQFLPGDIVYVFRFTHVEKERGSVGEFAFGSVGDILYTLSEDGFYSLAGAQISAIGQDKVNNWFLANSDITRRNEVLCFTANRPYVIWAYHSNSSVSFYDKVIIYNWAIQKWTRGSISAQMWAQLATEPLDLDTDGTEINDHWLEPPSGPEAHPLDSFLYVGGRPKICAVDQNGVLGSLDGPNLPATMETGEAHLVPGMRAFVSDVYPMIDSAGMQVAPGLRERLGDQVVFGPFTALEITGSAPLLTSSRLHRFRVTTPLGDAWTNGQGLLVEAQPDGQA